jgi:hypothetical protein
MKQLLFTLMIFCAMLTSYGQVSEKKVEYDSVTVHMADWQDKAYTDLLKEKVELEKDAKALNDRLQANADKTQYLIRGLAKEGKAEESKIIPNGIVYKPGVMIFKLSKPQRK